MTRIAGTGSSNRIFQGQKKDFIVMRKDTFEYTGEINYVDEDGTDATYDFTSCIGAMVIKKKKNDIAIVRAVSVSFDETEYTLYVDAEDMDMDAGKYYYDLQIYDADEHMVTKMYGDFIVLQDITDMLHPHDEEIYLTLESIIGYEKMDSFKSILLLDSTINYEKGEVNRIEIPSMGSSISYSVQPKVSNIMVMSTAIAYQLMTQWAKYTSIMGSEVGYMTTPYLAGACNISSEISWINLTGLV